MSKIHLTDSQFWNWKGWDVFKWILAIVILCAVIWTIWCVNVGKKPVDIQKLGVIHEPN